VPDTGANRRGILALTFGMAGFSANDAAVKLVGRDLPFGEIIFVRGVLTCVVLAVAVAALGQLRPLAQSARGLVLLRSLFDAVASALFVSALVRMPIAELSAIVLASPLIMTAMAVVLYAEDVGWRRWAAILIGLAGTLLIVKPTPGAFDAWALLGLGAAFGSAARDLTTRQLDPTIPSLTVTFLGSVAVMLSGLVIGLGEEWCWLTLREFALIALASAFLSLGTYLLVLAFRDVEISVVAPFRYTLLIWAGIGGYFVFGELPDNVSMLGAALIVASGLYTLHRETVRRRLARLAKK
jgi:drug/metabolite transporter (DMT)-like permease